MVELLNKYKFIIMLILLSVVSLLFMRGNASQEAFHMTHQTSTDVTPIDDMKQDGLVEENLSFAKEAVLVPVYICGAVHKPGVYQVEETAILNDILTLAEGLTKEADLNQINLAQAIRPNEKIYIPKIGEEIDKIPNSYENEERDKADALINMNNATTVELITLPGIGEVKAKQIVLYREQHGPFKSEEDLMNIPGLGQKVYEGLKGLITIE